MHCNPIITVDFFYLLIFLMCVVRHYFALATNPGEQFHYFVSLAAWLLRCCGRKIDQPQEVAYALIHQSVVNLVLLFICSICETFYSAGS